MRILRLAMTAFGPFPRTQEIDFTRLGEHPMFLINGPTGSGKTTILDGICYALYGETTGTERDGREMRCDHADPEQTTAKTWQETAIREALMNLESSERRIIMAYMDGASMSEIAREEGVAVGTMQGRFQRLARMLRSKHPELRRILLDLEF